MPLTHANLLANARDLIAVLNLKTDESILAMLPPFHSFGLMAGLVLPLAAGLRAVYHPNPTEAGPLVGLVRDFGLTLLATPPTFLAALLEKAEKAEKARGAQPLASLRLAFVGAEKCPERVYSAFAELCPQASLCEGYGITECSPVVSVNRPGATGVNSSAGSPSGSIGGLMPSLEAAVVEEKNGIPVARAATNSAGMLLVRGPSVFGGYLGDAPDPFVAFEGKSWYRTGDRISMDEAGRLTFHGRLKRFVKLGGEMISLPHIERVLLEAVAVQKDFLSDLPEQGPALAVEATAEEDGAEIILFSPLPLNTATANAALRAAGLSPLHFIKRVVRLDAIPLLGSGKTDYRALVGTFRDWRKAVQPD